MYGKRNDEIVRDFFGDALSAEEVAARGSAKEALYREMAAGRMEEMLVPGLREFLVRHQDLPMGVASNAEPENVTFFLEGTGLRQYFEAVVDGHQVARPKPYPDIYLRAAKILNTNPADCIVFEDSHSGVAAGLAAGMRVIGLHTTRCLPGTTLNVDNFWSEVGANGIAVAIRIAVARAGSACHPWPCACRRRTAPHLPRSACRSHYSAVYAGQKCPSTASYRPDGAFPGIHDARHQGHHNGGYSKSRRGMGRSTSIFGRRLEARRHGQVQYGMDALEAGKIMVLGHKPAPQPKTCPSRNCGFEPGNWSR